MNPLHHPQQQQQQQQIMSSDVEMRTVLTPPSSSSTPGGGLVDIPLARVKRVMKSDAGVRLISQEAVVAVAKAAELLVGHLAREAHECSVREGKRMVQYRDIAQAVRGVEAFDFLEDIIPVPQTLGSAIASSAAGRELR